MREHRRMRGRHSVLAVTLLVAMAAVAAPNPVHAAGDPPPGWRLPSLGASVVEPFEAPAHEYGPGHRGIDIGPVDGDVLAPATGVVAFAGTVVDRGVVTIDHGDGWVTSVEPVDPSVTVGEVVRAGEKIGDLDRGGHASTGTLHVGVRRDGEYVNPMLLLGAIPRAILLPCC
jgi:murein DD-endopeptidase MepM/ murein hydrolase activator NlpD